MPSESNNPVKGDAKNAAWLCGFLRGRLGLDVPRKCGILPPLIGHITEKLTKTESPVRKCAGALKLENRICAASGGGQSAFSPAGLIPAM
jgi:hypothetical protein